MNVFESTILFLSEIARMYVPDGNSGRLNNKVTSCPGLCSLTTACPDMLYTVNLLSSSDDPDILT